MKKTKLRKKFEAIEKGELQWEDLSSRELKAVERLIFKAIERKFAQNTAPSTRTLQ